jgi:hypothetical protein
MTAIIFLKPAHKRYSFKSSIKLILSSIFAIFLSRVNSNQYDLENNERRSVYFLNLIFSFETKFRAENLSKSRISDRGIHWTEGLENWQI